jgi:hypothetical protein
MPLGQDVQDLVTASAAATGPLPVAGLRWQLGPKAQAALVVQSSAALATFTLEGRITPSAPWVALHAANAALAGGAGQVLQAIAQALPEMRLNWTGNAGLVTAWVLA